MPKQRTRNQELEALSEAKLDGMLSGWVVNRLPRDFGIDFDVRITKASTIEPENQFVTGDHFSLQLKSTDDDCKDGFFEDLCMDDWILFLDNSTPVVLAKFYAMCDTMVYEIIQPYAWDILDKEDRGWKEGKQKRIRFSKKMDDIEILRKDVQDAFIRIIRKKNYYNTSIGEGLNPSDLDESRHRDLQEFKYKTLKTAIKEIRLGSAERGIALLEEAYSCPHEDILKFVVNLDIIMQLNALNFENHDKIVRYAEEGMELSKKVGEEEYAELYSITIYNVILVRLINKMSKMLYAKKVSSMGGGEFVPFYDEEIIKLYDAQNKINEKIQTSIETQLKGNNWYVLALSLSTLMDSILYQIESYSGLNDNHLEIEIKHRRPFIEIYEKLISSIDEESIAQFGYYLLAKYFYYTCDYTKSESYILKAIEIVKKLEDANSITEYEQLLDNVKNKRSPFDSNNHIEADPDKITFAQIKEFMKKSLNFQGIDTSAPDNEEYIQLAIEDADPTDFLRFCENLRIEYVGTSMVGRNMGLFSLGLKVLWCGQSGAVEGVSLTRIFQGFVNDHCMNCPNRKCRDQAWTCTLKEFIDMNSNPLFQQFLKKRAENG